MKRICLLIILTSTIHICQAQKTASELVNDLNKIISLYSSDNAATFKLLEATGTLDQKLSDANSQRIKLNDIGEVNVESSAEANTVSIHCNETGGCINIIKRDLSSSPSPSTAFFFVDAKSASLFARDLILLIEKFGSDHHHVKTNLPTEVISEPIVSPAKTESPKPNVENTKKQPTKSNLEINTDEYESEPKPSRNRKEENDDEDEKQSKATSKKDVKETVVEKDEDESPKPKTNKSKKPVKEDEDVSEAVEPPSRQLQNPMDKEPTEETVDAVCKQLMNIIQAGKRTMFKEIEGAVTNPEKKINESRAKIKGAKRCYLSWYKNQRAFIAEYKTLTDHELIIEEFLKLQTSLEDCLLGGWEDIDHSNDEMYANATEEVKDVEYKNTLESGTPSFRIMISGNSNKQYTLFVRIQ